MSTAAIWVPAVAGVVGTLAGALAGAGLTQVSLGRRDDRRWQKERDHERMIWAREDRDRTYDYRRQAYVGFLTEFERLIRTLQSAEAADISRDDLGSPAFEALNERWSAIVVYGTDAGQALATECLTSIQVWAINPTNDALEEDTLNVWSNYIERVRLDLGVPRRVESEDAATKGSGQVSGPSAK